MRDFSKINPSVWTSKRFTSLDDDGKLFYLYALTSPLSNSCGCYRLPYGYIMEDVGWDRTRIDTVCHTVSQTGLISYDRTEFVILIDRWYEYNPPNNPKHCLRVISELKSVPECDLKNMNAKDLFDFVNTRSWEKENVLSKLKPMLSDTVCHTVSRLGDTETQDSDRDLDSPHTPQNGKSVDNFNIENHLPDKVREKAKAAAAGWDFQVVIREYNRWIRKKGIKPDDPIAHFLGFCKNKGKSPP